MISAAALRLLELLTADAYGRSDAIPIPVLAYRLGIPKRTVQDLISELIDAGHLVGTSCSPHHNGAFLIADEDDLAIGTAHIRARAIASLRRVSKLKRAAAARFGPEALRLFNLEEAS